MRERLRFLIASPWLFLISLMWSGIVLKNKLKGWDTAFTSWAYRPGQRAAWRLFSRLGDGWLYVAYFLWLRFWGESPKLLAASVFLAWGISAALKLSFRRRRQNPLVLRRGQLFIKLGNWSFPSGHAACAIAFACATWPNPTGLIFAGLVCVSRVLIGAHYVSDVLAGVGVGLLAWRLA